ncbi:MAG: ATP-binding protein [Gemmatimonadetes bacterium]|nr:MAG: ATP-binding protein [Gemmatimonadota bacterium]
MIKRNRYFIPAIPSGGKLSPTCLTFNFDFPQQAFPVYADENALERILDNIISNAIKYSSNDTAITLRLSQTEKRVIVSISDQGLGLTETDKANLFQKFTRLSAKPTGGEHSTGLGLSIVKKLVEAMNGKVWAESEGKNKGSTFFVELPLAKMSNGI